MNGQYDHGQDVEPDRGLDPRDQGAMTVQAKEKITGA